LCAEREWNIVRPPEKTVLRKLTDRGAQTERQGGGWPVHPGQPAVGQIFYFTVPA
jgi:hypothetical protein